MHLQELIQKLQEIAATQSPYIPTNISDVLVDASAPMRNLRLCSAETREVERLTEENEELREELDRRHED